MQKIKSGIYIHIPFCESRCIYCGFYSTTQLSLHSRYVDAVIHEMDMRRSTVAHTINGSGTYEADTIYIGGGTPSTLPITDIERILKKVYEVYGEDPREITMEMNPDDITEELISAVKSFGVNRVSIGVQTFNDKRLNFLRRRHTANEARKAIDIIRNCGIANVSTDLMFGFPDETVDEWRDDIESILEIKPNHISAYSLMYEEGTKLYNMLEDGKVSQIGEDCYLAMYDELMDRLSAEGYEHYEISNFALPGYRSIHNSSYWHDIPYLGFGAAAHSYMGDRRSWNVSDLREYINAIENGRLSSENEKIDATTHYNDLITTTLRTCDGLNLNILSEELRMYAVKSAAENIAAGLLEMSGDNLRLTRKGLFVSDMVMSDMVKV